MRRRGDQRKGASVSKRMEIHSREDFSIRSLDDDDIPEIGKLKVEDGDRAEEWLNRFSWQFQKNPARMEEKPIGWVVATSQGVIKGHQMAIPQRFKVFDREQYIGFSGDTYIRPELRGQGFGVKLFRTYFQAQADGLALTSTANPASESIWLEKFGAIPLGDLNREFLYIYRSIPVLNEMLVRKFFSSKVMIYAARLGGVIREVLQKRPFPKVIDSILCHPVNPQDTSLDSIWKKYGSEYPITIIRDHVYRVWRYQHAPGPVPAMWLVKDNQNDLQAWFSLRVKVRGKTPVRVCELLDVFGPMRQMEFQRHVLTWVIRVGKETGADVLELKGLHPNWRSHLFSLGFVMRLMPSNPFLCKNMSSLEESLLREARNWHLCPADGDAAL